MRIRRRRPGDRRRAQLLFAALLAVLLGVVGSAALIMPAQAAHAGWAEFTFSGSSHDYSGTMTQQPTGFPAATYVSNSVGGASVGRQNGTNTYLSATTPVGAEYGSSKDRPYLNLRPYNQNGAPASVTTYQFDRPTPSSGWTFVLGDIDADKVTITATGAGGVEVPPSDLGFRSVFNYCTPGVCAASSDVPSWNGTTGVLTGNAGAIDTNGASAWFEPTVPLTSLSFTFAQRAGFPVYQTFFSALDHNLTGTVDVTGAPDRREGITVELYDPDGNLVGTTETDADGRYSFDKYATYDAYRVSVVRPTGLTSDGPLSNTVDLSTSDETADFTLRAIVGVSAGGTVRDPDGNPVPGVTVTLRNPNTGATTTQVTDGDGNYLFDPGAAGSGWSVTATAPDGTTVSGPRTFDVPVNSEAPIRNLDFVVTPIPTGIVSGAVTQRGNGPLTGIPVEVTGPGGITYRPVTDDDGNWSLEDLPPGTYSALVEPPAGMTVDTKDPLQFTIPPTGGSITHQDFELVIPAPPTHSASGSVTDDTGTPIPGVEVAVTDPTDGSKKTATTGDDGTWTVDRLIPATGYTAAVTVPDGYQPTEPKTFTVDTTDVDGVDFALVPTKASATPPASPSPSPSPSRSASPTAGPTAGATTSEPTAGTTSSSVPSSSGLANTGGPSLLIGVAAVVLLAGGVVTLLIARRRSR